MSASFSTCEELLRNASGYAAVRIKRLVYYVTELDESEEACFLGGLNMHPSLQHLKLRSYDKDPDDEFDFPVELPSVAWHKLCQLVAESRIETLEFGHEVLTPLNGAGWPHLLTVHQLKEVIVAKKNSFSRGFIHADNTPILVDAIQRCTLEALTLEVDADYVDDRVTL